MVEAAFAGGADIHSGALANSVEALEDCDRAGVVTAGLFRHSKLLHKSGSGLKTTLEGEFL